MDRADLIALVQRIMCCDVPSGEAYQACLDQLEEAVPDPDVLDYIFFPETDMTAEQIVDKALAYTPIVRPQDPHG